MRRAGSVTTGEDIRAIAKKGGARHLGRDCGTSAARRIVLPGAMRLSAVACRMLANRHVSVGFDVYFDPPEKTATG
jgi:hypothetical protein